jgi:hypothetical protein
MTKADKTLEIGQHVRTQKHGTGVVCGIEIQTEASGFQYPIFAVLFANGDKRHFRSGDLVAVRT